jgi:hypothetical protein
MHNPPLIPDLSFPQVRKKIMSTLIPEECTFQPRTNVRRPASAAVGGAGAPSSPSQQQQQREGDEDGSGAAAAGAGASAGTSSPGDRLFAQAAARARRLQVRQAQAVSSLNFYPTILPRSAALVAKDKAAHVDRTADLYQRVSDI